MSWETVIGLEIHVQLATQSKIFSGSSTAFGADPNTQASAIDLALPGTLPVPNVRAFEYAVMFGLAIDADIGMTSEFERKNYFYPDLPKGYQTTQLARPIVGPGHVDIQLSNGRSKTVRIHHAHLEEDAGKSLHEDFHGMSGIDLNRAGTPLIEIVTEPDMCNAEEAVAFAKKLHSLVTSLGICDGEMAQGSMRFDVNISVRRPGEPLGTRTETKNLNSFRFMEEAIKLEVERQIDVLEDGGKIIQETRLYNGDTKKARAMRSKEEANDYRYFPCPDLLPVILDDAFIATVRDKIPELPDAKAKRFEASYQLSAYDAGILAADRQLADYFEETATLSGQAKLCANWLMGDISAKLNASELSIAHCPVKPLQLAGLIARINDDTISNKQAKTVFDLLWEEGGSADEIIEKHGMKQVSDTGALEQIVAEVLASKPQEVANYLAAEESKRKKMMGAFMGPIMQATKGQANPGMANKILAQKLAELAK